MLLAHYRHRLPADHDMGRVRARVAERGPLWDDAPGLGFKAFAIRERASGAATNAYASLYLWLASPAAVDFLTDDRFASVIESFGRPRVATWLPFDIRAGDASGARSLRRDDRLIGPEADLAALRGEEAERSRALIAEGGVVATVIGLDAAEWRLTRFTLSAEPPDATSPWRVLHLAKPGFPTLS